MHGPSYAEWQVELPDDSWDRDLFAQDGQFLQSTHWGAFKKALGHEVFFGRGDGWQCLAILERTNRTTRLYCPYGPTAVDEDSYVAAVHALRTLGREQGASFVRVEPYVPLRTEDLERLGHRPAIREIVPSLLWVQDLSKSRDELIAEFSKNNRQRYRNAHKKDIRIVAGRDIAYVPILLRMLQEVAEHNKIVQHPNHYFVQMARTLTERNAATLYTAWHADDPVSAAIVFDSPTTRHVAHSGSLHKARHLHPGAIMRATMILDAKEQGQRTFDSLGVAPPDQPDHEWAGLTEFKKSFGGRYKQLLGTWEVPCSNWYPLYRSAYSAYTGAQTVKASITEKMHKRK